MLANRSVDIPAMEAAYTATLEAPPTAAARAASAASVAPPVLSAGAAGEPESLDGFRALMRCLTEQQTSITGMTLEVVSLFPH